MMDDTSAKRWVADEAMKQENGKHNKSHSERYQE